MVAAGLVSLVVLFVVGLIPSFKISNRRANTELEAGALAQSFLEVARSKPLEEVTTSALGSHPIDGVTYLARQEVSEEQQAGTPPKLVSKRVRVVVTWQWSDRQLETFRETIVSKIPRP